MIDLSIDIETMGNHQTACVTQIGWAFFDPDAPWKDCVKKSGSILIDLDDCLRHGLTVNKSCIDWWFNQSDAVRSVLGLEAAPLTEALSSLNFVTENYSYSRMWASAPSFDYGIIANAYQAANIKPSWSYKKQMCLRTLRKITPWLSKKDAAPLDLVQHVAEEDAIRQAVEVNIRLRSLKEKINVK